MQYVLIIVWLASNSATSTTAEFSSKDACEKAAIAIQKERAKFLLGEYNPSAFCFPKG